MNLLDISDLVFCTYRYVYVLLTLLIISMKMLFYKWFPMRLWFYLSFSSVASSYTTGQFVKAKKVERPLYISTNHLKKYFRL